MSVNLTHHGCSVVCYSKHSNLIVRWFTWTVHEMASVADALAAANAATAVITATDARIDAIEIGQTAIATQLAQFLALVQGGGAGGGGAG